MLECPPIPCRGVAGFDAYLNRVPVCPAFSHFPLIVSALAFRHGRHHRSDQTRATASH